MQHQTKHQGGFKVVDLNQHKGEDFPAGIHLVQVKSVAVDYSRQKQTKHYKIALKSSTGLSGSINLYLTENAYRFLAQFCVAAGVDDATMSRCDETVQWAERALVGKKLKVLFVDKKQDNGSIRSEWARFYDKDATPEEAIKTAEPEAPKQTARQSDTAPRSTESRYPERPHVGMYDIVTGDNGTDDDLPF